MQRVENVLLRERAFPIVSHLKRGGDYNPSLVREGTCFAAHLVRHRALVRIADSKFGNRLWVTKAKDGAARAHYFHSLQRHRTNVCNGY